MTSQELSKLEHEELIKYAQSLQTQISTSSTYQTKIVEESLLHDLFDNSNELIFVCTPFGDFLSINQTFCEKLGYPRQELKALNITSLVEPSFRASNLEQMKEVMRVGESKGFHTALLTKASKILYVSGKVDCIYRNNKLTAIRGIIHDVSEQIRIEDELLGQSARLSAIFESGSHIIWTVNRQREFTSFNQNYIKTLQLQYGITPSINTSLDELRHSLVHEGTNKMWKQHFKKAFDGEVQHFEIQSSDLKGNRLWREIFLNPIPSLDGTITEVSAIAHDITAKKHSEIALLDSENKFRSIFESFQDIYFRSDTSGYITMISPSVKELCGYDPKEMIGKHFFDYHSQITDAIKQATKDLYKLGRVKNIPIGLRCKDESVIETIINVRLLNDASGFPIALEGVIRDITERSKASKELLKAKEIAEKSLKVKESFLANMSHEIRTPMNGVIGMVDLLASTPLSAQQTDYVQTIKKSSETLMYILNDILDLSKIEADKMSLFFRSICIRETIEKVLALFLPKASNKNLSLNFQIQKSVPARVWADETRLIQILSNLVSNAIKFTDHGSISIDVVLIDRHLDSDEECLIKIFVKDTGIGIDPKYIDQIFEEFDQIDVKPEKSYMGTGLGLLISKNLVKLMDGQIGVDSTLGQGSTFWFTFKTRISQQMSSPLLPQKELQTFDQSFKGTKILVVDDNAINRKVAQEIFQKIGCEVHLAQDGAEAIQITQRQTFDLIFMDIQMPNVDGIEATRAIHKLEITTPIIAMTAYAMKQDRERFIDQGFDDYISKPITADKLISYLQHWTVLHNMIDRAVLDKLISYAGHDFLQETFGDFAEEMKQYLAQCTSLVQQGNYKEVAKIMHTIKGTASTLGVKAIHLLSKDIEMIAQQNPTEPQKISSALHQLQVTSKIFRDNFQLLLK